MIGLSKQSWLRIARIVICAAALWFVARGVSWNDRVVLRENLDELKGTIVQDGERVQVNRPDGSIVELTPAEIATDKEGSPRISYGLRSVWHGSSKTALLLAVLIHLPVGLLQGLRIQRLLSVQAIHLSFWDCVKLSFAGNFLNFAAPLGSNAGDVFKAYFVSLHTERRTEAVTTVGLDRIIGLGTLVLAVAAITVFSGPTSRISVFRTYVLSMLGIGALGALLYFLPAVRSSSVVRAIVRRVPVPELVLRVDLAARTLVSRWPILLYSILLTLMLQALAVSAYFAVAVAVGLHVNATDYFECYAYFCTGAVVQALPGPPQGLGTVELTYRYFFGPYGSAAQIICMSLALRIVVLVCALPGALVALTGSYRPRIANPNISTVSQPPSRPVDHRCEPLSP